MYFSKTVRLFVSRYLKGEMSFSQLANCLGALDARAHGLYLLRATCSGPNEVAELVVERLLY